MTAPLTEVPATLAGDFPSASLPDWRRLVDKALNGGDFDHRLVARTADGLRIEPLFSQRPAGSVALPTLSRHQGLAWDIRQVQAETDPAAVNAAILEDLTGGATSVLLQIAAPGLSGVPGGRADLARALDGVLLDVCPVALKAGAGAVEAAASLIQIWDQQGLAGAQRRGAFNYDPLGTLAETGGLPISLPQALAQAAELVRQALPWPHVTVLRADGHVWHAAGASEAQELAGVLAVVVAYLRAVEVAGITPAQALPKIAINLAVDADQIMGLAKFRAIRRLVTKICEACGAPGAVKITVTAETARAMMTKRDPWVNMLRTTMAAATAAMGGADCITVLPFTWALGQPDAFARRMARNTSIVLMEESGLARVLDPAGGSFAIETLTADLEQAAWKLFQKIEAAGGLAAMLSTGAWQNRIAHTATAKRQAIATGKIQLTGTTAFPRLGDDGITVTPWPEQPTLGTDLDGARVLPLEPFRASEPFELLRARADKYAVRHGEQPRVFLACLGPLASHATRATWTANFLAAGGITVVQSEPLLQSAYAGQAFADSGASVACICGSDESYGELGDAIASLLRTAGATEVYLAGRPKRLEAALQQAGVSGFIFAGCDMIETLGSLQAAIGVDA